MYGQGHRGSAPLDGWAGYGAAVCLVLAVLLAIRRVTTRTVDQGALGLASALVLAQLGAAFTRHQLPTPHLYFSCVFVGMAAYAVLPVRLALLYGAGLLALLLGLQVQAGGGNLTLLVDTAITLVLIGHISVFGQHITAERTESGVHETLALSDPLTGAANRRAVYPLLEQRHTPPDTRGRSAVILLDIDHFKRVNDEFGHLVGDEILQQLTRTLQQTFGGHGTVARWGGEEFLVVLQGVPRDQLADLGERCCAAVRKGPQPLPWPLTVSCGVAHAAEAASVQGWVALADCRLYHAKQQGRDQAATEDTVTTGLGDPPRP
ncbi:GGDEF domain-containing protein [Deinococcus sonorensis]|uniref:GGDEF domain-containing protein n=2 Tax=Deinococcus sonorensis TaxID=309891 RepID=A0AAU7U7K1_9DEIO